MKIRAVIEGEVKDRLTSLSRVQLREGKERQHITLTSGGESALSDWGLRQLPPLVLQSSRLHRRGIILACTSKRNWSSYRQRIRTLRVNERWAERRSGWDRWKGISESELCGISNTPPRPSWENIHECVDPVRIQSTLIQWNQEWWKHNKTHYITSKDYKRATGKMWSVWIVSTRAADLRWSQWWAGTFTRYLPTTKIKSWLCIKEEGGTAPLSTFRDKMTTDRQAAECSSYRPRRNHRRRLATHSWAENSE